jgi:hypothetical protein
MQNLNICCLLFTLNFIIKYFYPISHKIFNMFDSHVYLNFFSLSEYSIAL